MHLLLQFTIQKVLCIFEYVIVSFAKSATYTNTCDKYAGIYDTHTKTYDNYTQYDTYEETYDTYTEMHDTYTEACEHIRTCMKQHIRKYMAK